MLAAGGRRSGSSLAFALICVLTLQQWQQAHSPLCLLFCRYTTLTGEESQDTPRVLHFRLDSEHFHSEYHHQHQHHQHHQQGSVLPATTGEDEPARPIEHGTGRLSGGTGTCPRGTVTKSLLFVCFLFLPITFPPTCSSPLRWAPLPAAAVRPVLRLVVVETSAHLMMMMMMTVSVGITSLALKYLFSGSILYSGEGHHFPH